MRFPRIWCQLFLTCLSSFASYSCIEPGGQLALYEENDVLALGNKRDQGYTNGLEFEYSVPLENAGAFAQSFGSLGLVKALSVREGKSKKTEPIPDHPPEVMRDGNFATGYSDGITGRVKPSSAQGQSQSYEDGFVLGRADRISIRSQGVIEGIDSATKGEINRRFLVALGQQIYTPGDLEQTALIPNDRPYAAWLYVQLGIDATRLDPEVERRKDSRTRVQLALGVVGPAALGDEVQSGYHELIHSDEPKGWDNQLDNEFGVVLTARRDERILFERLGSEGRWQWDSVSHASVSLGNVFTNASTGNVIRFGRDLPRDWPGRTVAPERVSEKNRSLWGWYLYGGVDGRLVIQDIFLDGNTSESSHSVDKETVVADMTAGIAVRMDHLELIFSYVHRTEEFQGQDGPQKFGSIALRYSR